jgi:hypothetical protein
MPYKLVCIVFVVLPLLTRGQTVDSMDYSVVMRAKISGILRIMEGKENEYRISCQFNDRGRGDSTETFMRVSDRGLITWLQTSGVDYYKNAYSEQFNLSGDSAIWQINAERKSARFNNQLYTINANNPAILALSMKWLLSQNGQKTSVLPEGFMHATDPLHKTIAVNGKNKSLLLCTYYVDPSSTPNYLWMTGDMHFFAVVDPWFTIIQKGFESWKDSLYALQEQAGQVYYKQQLSENSQNLKGHVILIHANLFDAATALVRKNSTIEITDGKIFSIYPDKKTPFSADTIIDCSGKLVMPGLWDMHEHYSKDVGAFYLAGGVTHVRDMGNDEILLSWKQQIYNNALLGPDISYLSGLIDKVDPMQAPIGTMINSLEEGITAIDHFHQAAYDQIKLYSAIKPEWVPALAKHAHDLGMRVSGHIPAYMTAEQAIDDGYDEITHMNFIFLNFMGDTIDTRTPKRFSRVGEDGGKLDLQSAQVQRFIALMKNKHISLDATMNAWQGMFEEFNGDTIGYLKPVAGWVSDSWIPLLTMKSQYGPDSQKIQYKAAFANMLNMLKLMYDNGILLVAGTDGGEANALHHELELYVRSGIPPAKVLQIATYNAALDCHLQNEYGQILPGRKADLIIIDGDPSVNISDIRRVETVIKNGKLYKPKKLMQTMGWKYYY